MIGGAYDPTKPFADQWNAARGQGEWMEAEAAERERNRRFLWSRIFSMEDALSAFGVPFTRERGDLEIQVRGRVRGAALIGFGVHPPCCCFVHVECYERPFSLSGPYDLPRRLAVYSLEYAANEYRLAARWLAAQLARRPLDPSRLPMARGFPRALTERAAREHEEGTS